MNDLKNFKHGEEGTHYACKEKIGKLGGFAWCCECNGHKCKQEKAEEKKLCQRHFDDRVHRNLIGRDEIVDEKYCEFCQTKAEEKETWEEDIDQLIRDNLQYSRGHRAIGIHSIALRDSIIALLSTQKEQWDDCKEQMIQRVDLNKKSESELKAMILYELLTAKNITKKQKIKMLELNIEKHIEEQPEGK